MEIHHLGIATSDGARLVSLYSDLLGASVAHEETFDSIQIWFIEFDNGFFEVLEPLENEETISRFLEKSGEGIHHIAVETKDIRTALNRARELDLTLIDESPRDGAWGHKVAFLHPKSTGGVLIEFVSHN